MRTLAAGLATSAALFCAGFSGDAQSAETQQEGHALYVDRCGACHLENGFATRVLARRVPEGEALLEKRTVLPPALVTAAVRGGIGSMPAIREAELSDAELAVIADYLKAPR